ncbi:muconolactone Delta-isomerase [Paeniglutamicibacter gangotriensis]|uniref:Muconolactone Delta-isomerase n=2 Tax=Bacillati TaxID=1783272 RepID=M7MQV7_9MICC|nr:muconolactone Delta-isomerase family protein [Paeniglutamicibacter gangotriensis]EMQ97446.1 Muconolactone Delta-isomerase [Paeniglutamicibacter gangotriensis Lz1y]
MEFLVRFETTLPPGMDSEEVGRLKTNERKRATELRQEGKLVRLWRVPGRRAVVGLWKAASTTELHEAIASLPQFPWMDVTVEPLALHPQEL